MKVQFTVRQTELLDRLSREQGVPKVQLLRRALALLDFCEREKASGRCFGSWDEQREHFIEVVP